MVCPEPRLYSFSWKLLIIVSVHISEARGICQEGFTLSGTPAFLGLTPVFCSDATQTPVSSLLLLR